MRYLSQICPALAKAAPGNSYFLLNRSAQRSQLPALPDNFQWIQVPDATASLPRRLLWLQVGLPRVLRSIGADVLFAASDVSTLRPPCPMVLMVHNFNPFSPNRVQLWSRGQLARMSLHRWLIRRSAQKASLVIFVSHWSQQEISPMLGLSLERTAVIYHGVDQTFQTVGEASPDPPKQRFLLAVSEVLEHKNLQRLVEAYANLLQDLGQNLDLVIAGTITSSTLRNSLEASLSDRGLSHRVKFTGVVTPKEMATLYRQAELLVFPSLVETFGLPLIEAMVSGLPVVASHTTAIPEICGDAARYFDPLDVSAMTQAMKNVLTDSSLRESQVKKGLERASRFSWDTAAAGLLDNLGTALSESR